MDSILPGIDAAPNIHPIFVHFPIALWLVALLFWGLGTLRQRDNVFVAGRWVLYLGTLAALFAVGSGFWATEKMGHDTPGHDLVHVHRDFMLVTTGLAVVTTILAFVWRRSTSKGKRWAQLALLAVTTVVMTLGADRGAELVFRYGVGVAGEQPAAVDGHDHEHGDHGDGHPEPNPDATVPGQPGAPAPIDSGAVDVSSGAAPPQDAPAKVPSKSKQHDHHDHDHGH